MRKLGLLVWAIVCLFFCAAGASAAEAEDLSDPSLVIQQSGVSNVRQLFDGRVMESVAISQGGSLTLRREGGIGSLYLLFAQEPGCYTLQNEGTGMVMNCGEAGFLHEFLDLEAAFGAAPEQVTIRFEAAKVQLCELYGFGPGQAPDWVQRWEKPAQGEADLVLFSTHGDDEQLFFAGLLPYYAGELGYRVQVVYFTRHENMPQRVHEMLDGLWAVGVGHYPVFGPYGDYYTTSLEEARQRYSYKGNTMEEMLGFVVENIRRFRPKVAVGHDLEGEYGHGMHRLYAALLREAVELSGDESQYPQSAEAYGAWDVPKTYLHLYPENTIQMDWDVPLERFGGMTAFEVTRDLGFPCHASQQRDYSWYFAGKAASWEITEYSPRAFGLCRSTVGADIQGGDFFENVTTHAQDAALEAQRAEEENRQKLEELQRRAEEAAQEPLPATQPQTIRERETKAQAGLLEILAAFFEKLFGFLG